MSLSAPKCANVTLWPTPARLEWCEDPAWVAALDGYIGLAACDDSSLFVAFDDGSVFHAHSVGELQGILRA